MLSYCDNIIQYLRLGEITARVVRAPTLIFHLKELSRNHIIRQTLPNKVSLLRVLSISIRMTYIQGCPEIAVLPPYQTPSKRP
jgi:hypothetical protein